jgi:CO/xanthine dehydrogenase FAD-binding subunit
MKPAPFEYACPDSLEEALALLSSNEDAKLMSGGQSLLPMMNFRVVRPQLVIDISKLVELSYVREVEAGGLLIGALTRHRVLETSPVVANRFPIVCEAMRHVAHLAIRNRGTIGGSLSHADPAAELPMLTLLLDATMVIHSVRGVRRVAASEFFVGALTTSMEEDEVLVEIELPGLARGTIGAFEEVNRRPGDFALAAAGVLLEVHDGVVANAKLAMMGLGETPLRSPVVEGLLRNQTITNTLVDKVVEAVRVEVSPRQDLHASSEFRRHLAGVVVERALKAAWSRTALVGNSEATT